MRRTVRERNGMYSLMEGVSCDMVNLIQMIGLTEDRAERLEREIQVLGNRKNEIHFAAEPIKESLFAEGMIHIENLTVNIQVPGDK